jgi:hypothetical protein
MGSQCSRAGIALVKASLVMAHIIITGPGRSGTTFLLRLLTVLGFDTGFKPDDQFYYDNLRAGFEYISEDFSFDEPAPGHKAGYLQVEHVILPIRDLDIAVKSRLDVGLFWKVDLDNLVESQTEVMAAALGRVVEACVLFELPCTVLRFPELVTNEEYCFYKLTDVFDISRPEFRKVFRELSNPEQIKWQC